MRIKQILFRNNHWKFDEPKFGFIEEKELDENDFLDSILEIRELNTDSEEDFDDLSHGK